MTDTSMYAFMEVNPRLQVEHTITEEILDVDLVQLQLRIAGGASLSDLGLGTLAPRGCAIQVRLNMETMLEDGSSAPTGGTLTTYEEPGGRGVRIDSMGYAGYLTSSLYDSLLAKLICHSSSGFDDARQCTYRALCEFSISGVQTNHNFVQNVLCHPAFCAGHLHTAFVVDHIEELLAGDGAAHSQMHFEGAGKAGLAAAESIGSLDHEVDGALAGPGAITTVLTGTIVKLLAHAGDRVIAGQPLCVISAMKMESTVAAQRSGTLLAWNTAEGQAIQAGSVIATLDPDDDNANAADTAGTPRHSEVAMEKQDGDWSEIIEGIQARCSNVLSAPICLPQKLDTCADAWFCWVGLFVAWRCDQTQIRRRPRQAASI